MLKFVSPYKYIGSLHWVVWRNVIVAPPSPHKYIGNIVPNLTFGGTGKWKKDLHDLSQTFTDIKTMKVMNMCQITSICLTAETNNSGQKTVETGSKM